ncbi:MAG: hypothetical protein ACJAZK_000081 [Psychroserpens sp.]
MENTNNGLELLGCLDSELKLLVKNTNSDWELLVKNTNISWKLLMENTNNGLKHQSMPICFCG